MYNDYYVKELVHNYVLVLDRVKSSPEANFNPMFEYLLDPAIQNDKYEMWTCINR